MEGLRQRNKYQTKQQGCIKFLTPERINLLGKEINREKREGEGKRERKGNKGGKTKLKKKKDVRLDFH